MLYVKTYMFDQKCCTFMYELYEGKMFVFELLRDHILFSNNSHFDVYFK